MLFFTTDITLKKAGTSKEDPAFMIPIGYQLFRQIFVDACGSLAAFAHG